MAADDATLLAAVERAFGEIARIHGLMSHQDEQSELSRLNRAAPGEWLAIHPDTETVLRFSLELWALSKGRFDPAARTEPSLGEPVFEVEPGRARRLAPASLDLGGVAKGYAVDRAVAALVGAGLPGARGSVNAGGDLRLFGEIERTVSLVSGAGPDAAGPRARELRLRGGQSVASSSSAGAQDGVASRFHDPLKGRPFVARRSCSVVAPECMAADALTKVVLLAGGILNGIATVPNEAETLIGRCLARFSAEALLTDDDTGATRVYLPDYSSIALASLDVPYGACDTE